MANKIKEALNKARSVSLGEGGAEEQETEVVEVENKRLKMLMARKKRLQRQTRQKLPKSLR